MAPAARPLSLDEALPMLARTRVAAKTAGLEAMGDAAASLEARIEGLLGAETPSSFEACERTLDRAEQAARAAADLMRSSSTHRAFAETHGVDLVLVNEAVSRHVSRLEMLARTLGTARGF
ncbi:hypothetical protein SPF06_04490 [Sinomonas sp. JGH33]|uniref:Uncharacterized protein n=1 Tax=Sinomonas terricola TaxID=3110330 RepID=A0ABU5T2S4_9MICC|nr:hypothetical protein [Sinomonas sp. JGH33]MEA5453975.1 hypothetical protein [Sinomonas sp. JGH33]